MTAPRPADPCLVDSSIWIPAYRRRPPAGVASRLLELLQSNAAAVNEQIELEILLAYSDRREFERIRDEFRSVVRLPIVKRTWRVAGDLGFELRRSGLVVATPDLLVAASAFEHDVLLVHADRDFDLIAQHASLKVESHVSAGI